MPGALAVVGSNPTGPIESSVQSPIILKYPLSNQVHHGTNEIYMIDQKDRRIGLKE
jgi:hypothetical protein